MNNWIRHLPMPAGVNLCGPVVKRETFNAIAQAEHMLAWATERTQDMERAAQRQLEEACAKAIKDAAKQYHDTHKKLEHALTTQLQVLTADCEKLCYEVCKLALNQFISDSSDEARLRVLISHLLQQLRGEQQLSLAVHPSQVQVVNELLQTRFSQLVGLYSLEVQESKAQTVDKLTLTMPQGASIEVSVAHLVAMYQTELEILQGAFSLGTPQLQGGEL